MCAWKTLCRWARPWGGAGRSRTAMPRWDGAGLPAALGHREGGSRWLGSLEAAGLCHGMGALLKAQEFGEKPAVNVSTKVISLLRNWSWTQSQQRGDNFHSSVSKSVWINWYHVLAMNGLGNLNSEERKASSFPAPVIQNLHFVHFHFYTEWSMQGNPFSFWRKESFRNTFISDGGEIFKIN